MPSFKATVVGPQGARVRKVQVEVKPVIQKLAAPADPRAPTHAAPTPAPAARAPTPAAAARTATPRTPGPGVTRPPAVTARTPSKLPQAGRVAKPGKPEPRAPRKGGMPKRKPRS
jgi:2-oxoglutarate dehydrogenase E2 component (dihydrolipoamide succinyltransferase)